MSDAETANAEQPIEPDDPKPIPFRRLPLSILLTIAVFYIVLLAMCAFVVVIILRG